ncbi:inorganic phosphate transporter (plasmid) [Acetobacter pasteurianus]|nr:inorganic phosphate transporter [Acetobacter pasteurianus]
MCTDPFRLRLRQKRYVVMLSIFLIVLIALFFDYTNGRHDSALITGPVISTGTLSPRIATIFAALCTFSACLIFGLHVSNTLGHGLVNPQAVTPLTIAVTLLAAAIWNLLAQKTGVPTSSSHALIGALVGAVTFSAGPSNVIMSGLTPVMTAIVVAPLLGFIGGIILTAVCAKLLKNAASPRLNNLFRPLQILSCGLLALAHGGNDAQKTMGIITLTLASAHYLPSGQTPLWVILSCQSAITIGTMAPQSGKMFRAVSQGITRIRPWQGASAQGAAGLVLSLATLLGIPVSSTHVQTGALAGVGAIQSVGRVRWGTITRMAASWIITLPAAALMSGAIMTLTSALSTLFH